MGITTTSIIQSTLRRLSIVLVAVLWLLVIVAACCLASNQSLFRKTPYLVYRGDPSEMTIMWQSSEASSPTIEVRPLHGEAAVSVDLVEGADHLWRADALGLTPDAVYSYTVSLGQESLSSQFTAAPDPGSQRTVFFGIADTQYASCPAWAVANVMRWSAVPGAIWGPIAAPLIPQLAKAVKATSGPTFCLHAGDWVDCDGDGAGSQPGFSPDRLADEHEWDKLMGVLAPAAAIVPIEGCRGNHDLAKDPASGELLLAKYYPYAYATPGCWSFDFGAVHVDVVDSERLQAMKYEDVAWLVNDVEQARARPWTILLIHDVERISLCATRDAYRSRWQFSENTLLEALRDRGLDLIVSGHFHGDDFLLWDGAVPYWDSAVRDSTDLSNGIPLLVMSTAFGAPDSTEARFRAYYYRYTANGQTMTIDVFDVAGKEYGSYSVTSRP